MSARSRPSCGLVLVLAGVILLLGVTAPETPSRTLPPPTGSLGGVGGGTDPPTSLARPAPWAQAFGWIRGTVTPSSATVSINSRPIAVGNGSFNVTEPANRSPYVVAASAIGYVSNSTTVTVTPGNVTVVAFTLAAEGAINGTVVPPFANVFVDYRQVNVSPTGHIFVYEPARAAPYNLSVVAPGFSETDSLIYLTRPAQTVQVNVVLQPLPPCRGGVGGPPCRAGPPVPWLAVVAVVSLVAVGVVVALALWIATRPRRGTPLLPPAAPLAPFPAIAPPFHGVLCTRCGVPSPEGLRFCSNCGAPLVPG